MLSVDNMTMSTTLSRPRYYSSLSTPILWVIGSPVIASTPWANIEATSVDPSFALLILTLISRLIDHRSGWRLSSSQAFARQSSEILISLYKAASPKSIAASNSSLKSASSFRQLSTVRGWTPACVQAALIVNPARRLFNIASMYFGVFFDVWFVFCFVFVFAFAINLLCDFD